MNVDKDVAGDFTPALGFAWLTPAYDQSIRLFTREDFWRKKILDSLHLDSNDTVLDVGCGTGSLALGMQKVAPGARIVGIDPDLDVLVRARNKAGNAGVAIEWVNGFMSDATISGLGKFSKVVSSLVLHQTPLEEKRRIIAGVFDVLHPGGMFCIADYGEQRSFWMKLLFRATVQAIDGVENTQYNADGVLGQLFEEAGYTKVQEVAVVKTVTGSISIYRAYKPL